MKALRTLLRLACAAAVAGFLSAALPGPLLGSSALLFAQSPSADISPVESEQVLFVQAPERDNGHGEIDLIWLPRPLQNLCLGKTFTQCATIDFCIRTTNRQSSQCRNIGVNLARIPRYPASTFPPRMESVSLMYLSPDKFANLQKFFKSAPRDSLKRISISARVKARIRFSRENDFDNLQILEVLAVSPF